MIVGFVSSNLLFKSLIHSVKTSSFNRIYNGEDTLTSQLNANHLSVKTAALYSKAAKFIQAQLPNSLKQAVTLIQEPGASSTWLTTLPIQEHGFSLHKGAFRDALALRYGWTPANLLAHCACGNKLTVEHAFSCAKGGFPSIRHNEIKDITATLLTEVCHVSIEPDLQPISNETMLRSLRGSRTCCQDSHYGSDGDMMLKYSDQVVCMDDTHGTNV